MGNQASYSHLILKPFHIAVSRRHPVVQGQSLSAAMDRISLMVAALAQQLVEHALEVHRRATGEGPMRPPDMVTLARRMFTLRSELMCEEHREASSRAVLLMVRSTVHDMPLNIETEALVCLALKEIVQLTFPSAGLDW